MNVNVTVPLKGLKKRNGKIEWIHLVHDKDQWWNLSEIGPPGMF
jgi:hypothetical protein